MNFVDIHSCSILHKIYFFLKILCLFKLISMIQGLVELSKQLVYHFYYKIFIPLVLTLLYIKLFQNN